MFNSLNINALHCFQAISYFNSDKTKDSTHLLDKCTGYQKAKQTRRIKISYTCSRRQSGVLIC